MLLTIKRPKVIKIETMKLSPKLKAAVKRYDWNSYFTRLFKMLDNIQY